MVLLHSMWSPFDRSCKTMMIIVVFLGMCKTFFYMRIFARFSPIVTMLTSVIADLKDFFIFFMILIMMFSCQISIIGIANFKVEGLLRDTFYEQYEEDWTQIIGYPQEELKAIGPIFGNIMTVFRASMGDFTMVWASLYID